MQGFRNETTDTESLTAYEDFLFKAALAEYENLPKPDAPDAATQQAIETAARIAAKGKESITSSDLFAFEFAITRLQPLERLRRRICVLRAKYLNLFGKTAFDTFLKCPACDLSTTDIEKLRAELDTLLGEFRSYYAAVQMRNTILHDIRRTLLYPVTGFALIVVLAEWIGIHYGYDVPGLAAVILAGLLGAFTSILRRLQDVQAIPFAAQDDPVTKLVELGFGRVSIYTALMSGTIFPVVLLLVFIAGAITGPLFPDMVSVPPGTATGTSFLEFARCTGPASGINFAKLLVWSFISGFAERFVPDILDKLAIKSKAIQSTNGG